MSTAIEERPKTQRTPLAPRPRTVLRNVSWDTYRRLSDEAGEASRVRMIYDRGRLEIVSPLPPHERTKTFLRRFVEDVAVGLRIPLESAGSARWTREAAERGLEPDECFFIAFEKLAIMDGRPANQPGDPVPDLAIEVDFSEHAADRASVYAALGIPELWLHDGDHLRIESLGDDGIYREVDASRFLPVTAVEVTAWVEKGSGINLVEWIGLLQAWVRDDLAPRNAADRRGD